MLVDSIFQVFFIHNDFQFTFLSITERVVLIPTIFVDVSISPFRSVSYLYVLYLSYWVHTHLRSLCHLDKLIFFHYTDYSLVPVIFLVLKSLCLLLIYLHQVFKLFLLSMFSWYVFLHPLNFNLSISLSL